MSELILHHFSGSPFAEKIRCILGFKGLPWRSVQIPRVMPKPDLVPLTGGYRRTPVMQVGADIFCDSACIARELERRYPAIAVFPAEARGEATILGSWADRVLFFDVIGVVFGTYGDAMPADLKEDRLRFSDGMIDAARYRDDQAHLRAQLRSHMFWVERMFDDGRAYVLGHKPCYADFCVYAPLWMLHNRAPELGFFADTPGVRAWLERMAAIGHGMPRDLPSREALAIARDTRPDWVSVDNPEEQTGLQRGTHVIVSADDYGRDPVEGYLVALNAQRIVIRRGDAQTGEVNVHFPRSGFRLAPAP